MNCEEYRSLLPEYWDGALADEDRAALELHLASCGPCREEVRALGDIWQGLGRIPEARPSRALRRRFYERLDAYRQGALESPAGRGGFFGRLKTWFPMRPAWQVGFGVAMLAIGWFGGYRVDNQRDNAQLTQLRAEVNSMRQLVTLSLLQQQNASERLRGVNWAYRVEQSDTEVLAALLETINHDPNVNVRLGAVDALHAFSASPVARRGLEQSLARQDSPLMQVAVIDALVDLGDARAVPAIDALSRNSNENPQVREHARWALAKLSR